GWRLPHERGSPSHVRPVLGPRSPPAAEAAASAGVEAGETPPGGDSPSPSHRNSLNRLPALRPVASMPVGPGVSPVGAGLGRSSTSSISPIGVIPNSGSRAKGQPDDRAPTSFPST